jgi:NADPH-dependent 2,4-dienoyl-CoA reductase/sulfur reductase-like enzyme
MSGKSFQYVDDGIVVNSYLQTSSPDIYAAGDNTNFMYLALGTRARLEHWDNAIEQGRAAGRNMAGAGMIFDGIPYFYSDLFEFGYEAVGEVDSRLATVTDWRQENETGIVYYRRDEVFTGVMLCNVWEKIEAARTLIRSRHRGAPERVTGSIPL